MRRLFKYFKSFELGLQSAMEYRADFLLGILSGSFAIIIQCFLWTAVYGSGGASNYYGYTYGQMMTYTILAGIVTKLVATGFEYEIADDIKNGGLNKFIVQPINYFIYRISCFFGRKSLQLGFILMLAVLVMIIFNSFFSLNTGLSNVLLFLPPILAALVLNFYIFLCVSTLAFWLTEIWAAFLGVNLVINILSGGIFPLDIFGETALRFFDLLPFKYTIYYPISILNGRISSGEVLQGLIVQCIWIGLLYLLSKALWRMGMKKYVAVGG